MKRLVVITTFAVATLSLSGCATQSAAPDRLAPLGGPATRVVELPSTPGAGGPRDVRVLIDEPGLKLASIVLRGGTVLPEHRSEVPVTIIALRGGGTVTAGTERLRLDPAHAVVLASNVSHAVEPDSETELVLVVHHLGRGEERSQ